MNQFLITVGEVIGLIGPEWRPFVVLALMYIGWMVAKKRGWINGHSITLDEVTHVVASQTEEMRVQFNSLELQVSNHIPAMIGELKQTMEQDVLVTAKLSDDIRDQAEAVRNAVKSIIVVLKKQDEDQRVLASMDTKLQVILAQGKS